MSAAAWWTIGSVAPFGPFGDHDRIINAFQGMKTEERVSRRLRADIAEALVTTAFGPFAVPAVMAFNFFTGKIETFELFEIIASELIENFLKKRDRSVVEASARDK